jgi:hypothetical protein
VLLSNGNGTFASAVNYSVGASPSAVVAADFTGTGIVDLAVANSGSGTVSILMGDGSGNLGTATNYAVGTNPVALVAGEIEGTGYTDLAVINNGSNFETIFANNGSGGFVAESIYTEMGLSSVALFAQPNGVYEVTDGPLSVEQLSQANSQFLVTINELADDSTITNMTDDHVPKTVEMMQATAISAQEPPPKIPTFSMGSPDTKAAEGTSWLEYSNPITKQMIWVTKQGGALKGFVYSDNKITPFGACKFDNGYNIIMATTNPQTGAMVSAYFYNIDVVFGNKGDFTDALNTKVAPAKMQQAKVNDLVAKGGDGLNEAKAQLTIAQGDALEKVQQFILRNTNKIEPSDKSMKILPDDKYYNALQYVWTSEKIVVSRLNKEKQWVVYDKVKGNGDSN